MNIGDAAGANGETIPEASHGEGGDGIAGIWRVLTIGAGAADEPAMTATAT